jgi:hypothetical protein
VGWSGRAEWCSHLSQHCYRGRVRCRVRCCIKYSTLTRRSRVAARRHAQASRHSWGARSSQHSHTPLARARRVHAQASRHSWGARSSQHAQASRHSWGARSSHNTHTRRSRVHTGKPLFALATRGAHARSAQHTHTRAARACTPTRASLRPLAPCMSESRCTPRVSALSRLCSLRRASAQWHPNGAIRRSCG